MSWAEIFNMLVTIATITTPLVLAGGLAWLQTKFVSKADHTALSKSVNTLSTAVTQLKTQVGTLSDDIEKFPTRVQLLERIGELDSRTAKIEGGVNAIGTQLTTQNNYLHTLIENRLKD